MNYNKNCLGVRFALCIIKALRLARIEHRSGTVVTPFLPSVRLVVLLLCFHLLLAHLLEDEIKIHPMHHASRHKVKDVENLKTDLESLTISLAFLQLKSLR